MHMKLKIFFLENSIKSSLFFLKKNKRKGQSLLPEAIATLSQTVSASPSFDKRKNKKPVGKINDEDIIAEMNACAAGGVPQED